MREGEKIRPMTDGTDAERKVRQDEAMRALWDQQDLAEARAHERPPAPSVPALTRADLTAVYSHLLRTLGWMLFWFSLVGGAAATVVATTTDNRLDYPLAIVAAVAWGTLAAAIAAGSRADLRRLRP